MSQPTSQKPCILLTEDDADLGEVLKTELEGKGFRVLWAQTVPKASQMLANQKFDAIIMDLRLQSNSTENIIINLRRDKKAFNFDTPMVVVSGNLDSEVIRRIARNINCALVKPFDFNVLTDKINQLCAASESLLPASMKAA